MAEVKRYTLEELQQRDYRPDGRKYLYENVYMMALGIRASCNGCDRLIFEDENDREAFTRSGGYCKECRQEQDVEPPQEDDDGHDGLCRCGAVVPCEETDCSEPPGHEYTCPECLAALRNQPDPDYLASERRYDE